MGMQIMQAQLVQKRLLDDLMGEQERLDRTVRISQRNVRGRTRSLSTGNIVIAIDDSDAPVKSP
jgi:hypothetical protein